MSKKTTAVAVRLIALLLIVSLSVPVYANAATVDQAS